MKCPYCGKDNNIVADSRERKTGIQRKRKCQSCGGSFRTFEYIAFTKEQKRTAAKELSSNVEEHTRPREEVLKVAIATMYE